MEYRLYIMDGLGKIGGVRSLTAMDHDEAVRFACRMKLRVTCEVWDRDRLVAEIPAHSEEPPA